MMPDASEWDRQSWLAIGRTLLTAESRTLTAPELAAAGRGHSSNVKRAAEAMANAGLLERCDPDERAPGTPGRAATVAYFLPDAMAAEVRARAKHRNGLGQMQPAMQLVFAEAGHEQVAALFEALAVGSGLNQASWFTLFDGEPQELAIAFSGDNSVEAAADLMAELRGAELRARRTTVTEVLPIDRLTQRARRTARAARRARMGRATREAS